MSVIRHCRGQHWGQAFGGKVLWGLELACVQEGPGLHGLMPVVHTQIEVPGRTPDYRGKVRDIYDLGDSLILVATDKLSAFDVVFNEGIPDKGKILTAISNFWFSKLDFVQNHILATQLSDFPEPFNSVEALAGRTVWVKKAKRVDFECVVRGYLAGSGWKEYQQSGTVCGQPLPAGLQESERLPELIFTPATKADHGQHDENVSINYMRNKVGGELTQALIELSFKIFTFASEFAANKGILLADTKFEFGLDPQSDEIILIDEVLTPDSSRYWPQASYQAGISPPSYDKQFVRDYLNSTSWDKSPPPPALPSQVIEKTAEKYKEIQSILCS